MSSRFISGDALVLRIRQSAGQEGANREAFFLTRELWVLRAIVYGGPKSKLRAHVSPFHSGVLYLYHDPVRDSYKVSDFDVRSWRPGIREMYERMMIAAAITETILASQGGGSDWNTALSRSCLSLDALEEADAATARRIALHFLWNWAELLGVRPDIEDSDTPLNIKNPGALRWLTIVEKLEPALLARYLLDDISLQYAKTLCVEILADALGRHLSGWECI